MTNKIVDCLTSSSHSCLQLFIWIALLSRNDNGGDGLEVDAAEWAVSMDAEFTHEFDEHAQSILER